jgi:hypothetical protein
MQSYDPNEKPASSEWLELDELDQVEVVTAYHKQEQTAVPNLQMHALIHVVVENQLAEGIEVADKALERLMADGLDRHEAIHAIGSVLVKHLRNLMQEDTAGPKPHERYFQDLQALTSSSWNRDLI